jgi:predicted deacylase
MSNPNALPAVTRLQVDDLPPDTRTNLWLELTHDSLGRPNRLPIVIVRGKHPGPVFGITAVIHGNEINGIPVIHRLVQQIDPSRLRGTLVCLPVVNIPAFLSQERMFDDRVDLNHIMPGKDGGSEAQIYAYRFVHRIVHHFDFLIDLHTASFGRSNSLYVRADMTDPVSARMAYLQRPQIILHNTPSDGTLRGAAMEMSIPAITLEIGNPQVFQPSKIASSINGLRRVLAELGMIPKRSVQQSPPPVLCDRSAWLYTDHGGILRVFPEVTDIVEKDEPIARITDIFGNIVREYVAPERGIVVGKSVNPVGPTGARILHLGHIVEEDTHPYLKWEHSTPLSSRR